MRTYVLIVFLCLIGSFRLSASGIEKIEPAFWWCGMKNPEVQLMVYGKEIAGYEPSINHAGVQIKEVATTDSPNYKIIYLEIAEAKPGRFDIVFTKGKKRLTHSYELKSRAPQTNRIMGFDASDVVYLLMPDRFANGKPENDLIPMRFAYKVDRTDINARHGGDLSGVAQRINYLSNLGVTAVWLNPVLENDMEGGSYHGYSATNYYKVDPRLGTNEEYVELIDKLHAKGLKIIMDMVFNHCGGGHPWVTDMPTNDWFNRSDRYIQTNHYKEYLFDPYASDIDTKEMTDGWFVPSMPDLNQRNRHVERYLIQNSIWWIEYAGLDGIRQDTYPYADAHMMSRWCNEVMNEYPQFNIVGEGWLNQTLGTAFWQKGHVFSKNIPITLPSTMDFRLCDIAYSAFGQPTSWNGGLQKIFEHMTYDFAYADINKVLRFLENHDTDRFLKTPPTDLNAFKQSMALLLTIPGIPQLYYGEELLMCGDTKEDFGYVRNDVPGGWADDRANEFTREGRSAMQNEAWDFVQTLLKYRKGNPLISRGTMKHYTLQESCYVYERCWEGRTVVVALNGSDKSVSLPIARYAETFKERNRGYDVLNGKHTEINDVIEIAPRGVRVIELATADTSGL